MIASTQSVLRSLLESSRGIHLTAYIANRGDLNDIKRQLEYLILDSEQQLCSILTSEERDKFLLPLKNLLRNFGTNYTIKGNVGIFRTMNAFRVLSLPIEVEPYCFVGSSFHVKPLLRWIQSDQTFLLLGIDRVGLSLYLGSQNSTVKLNSLEFRLASRREARESSRISGKGIQDGLYFVHEWLEEITKSSKPKLFITGEVSLAKYVYRNIQYRNLVRPPIYSPFDESRVQEIVTYIRKRFHQDVAQKLKRAIVEYQMAEQRKLGTKNILQIAKAAIQGRIKKLIVADGIHIFGKLDQRTGVISIHRGGRSHEEGDILDDLAQAVLKQGGEVVVASREDIPKFRPLLAILENKKSEVSELDMDDSYKFQGGRHEAIG